MQSEISSSRSPERSSVTKQGKLFRKLTQSSLRPTREQLGAEAMMTCNSQGRDFELKRRKTLDDYNDTDNKEDDDEEMLFL